MFDLPSGVLFYSLWSQCFCQTKTQGDEKVFHVFKLIFFKFEWWKAILEIFNEALSAFNWPFAFIIYIFSPWQNKLCSGPVKMNWFFCLSLVFWWLKLVLSKYWLHLYHTDGKPPNCSTSVLWEVLLFL